MTVLLAFAFKRQTAWSQQKPLWTAKMEMTSWQMTWLEGSQSVTHIVNPQRMCSSLNQISQISLDYFRCHSGNAHQYATKMPYDARVYFSG